MAQILKINFFRMAALLLLFILTFSLATDSLSSSLSAATATLTSPAIPFTLETLSGTHEYKNPLNSKAISNIQSRQDSTAPRIWSNPDTPHWTAVMEWMSLMFEMGPLSSAINAVGIVLTLLSFVLVVVRIFNRINKVHSPTWYYLLKDNLLGSDIAFVVAVICFFFSNAFAAYATTNGIGVINWRMDWESPLMGSKTVIIWGFAYSVSIIPVKFATAATLREVFCFRGKWVVFNWIPFIIICCAVVMQITWLLEACRPIWYLWDQVSLRGECHPIEQTVLSLYIFAILCSVADVSNLMMAILAITKLKMKEVDMLFALFMVAAGTFSCLVTVVRIFFIPAYVDMGYWRPGFYLRLGLVVILSQLEVGVAIIGGNLSAAVQLHRNIREHFQIAYAEELKHHEMMLAELLGGHPTHVDLVDPPIQGQHAWSTVVDTGIHPETVQAIESTKGKINSYQEKLGLSLDELKNCIKVTTEITVTSEPAVPAPKVRKSKQTKDEFVAELSAGAGTNKLGSTTTTTTKVMSLDDFVYGTSSSVSVGNGEGSSSSVKKKAKNGGRRGPVYRAPASESSLTLVNSNDTSSSSLAGPSGTASGARGPLPGASVDSVVSSSSSGASSSSASPGVITAGAKKAGKRQNQKARRAARGLSRVTELDDEEGMELQEMIHGATYSEE